MPQYRYTAKTEDGKKVRALAEAPDEKALYAKLRTDGQFMLSAKPAKANPLLDRRLRLNQVSGYCRELGTLLSAGVPLVRALAIMSEQEGLPEEERTIYLDMQRDIRKGISLSESMSNRGEAFPPLLIGMIRSAEGTGSIDRAALRMANHYEKEHRMNQQVMNTMMYPAILAVMIVGVVIFLLSYVVPQFEPLFSQMESLPLLTVVLFAISNFVKAYWPGILIGLTGGVVVLRMLCGVPPVRLWLDKMGLRLPVVGGLRRKIVTARFARTLSNLYSSGVPIVAALQASRDTVGNSYIVSQFENVLGMVRAGQTLSDALGTVDGFERKLISSIRVGEETGKLDSMLETISENMDYESEMATKRLMTLLEPVMIVFMGLIVAFVIVAVILPIYQSYSTIGASGSTY